MAVVASGREEAIRAEIFIRINDKLLIQLTFGRAACCTTARFLIVLNILTSAAYDSSTSARAAIS
jgi:hypothetical protein